ncbi:MAG: histidine phosphatase family protein [Actinomycetota bacterium]
MTDQLVPDDRVARLHLVRHGRAAAGWDTDLDPGLDDIGRKQAAETAEHLSRLDRMDIVSSPLRRCQETAAALSRLWADRPIAIEPRVAEIPSPHGVPMSERVEWLRGVMTGTWSDLDEPFRAFRRDIVTYVSGLTADTVIFSHFIAINVVVGECLGDDSVVIDSLDNASVTVVDIDTNGGLHIVERGRQANTLIR